MAADQQPQLPADPLDALAALVGEHTHQHDGANYRKVERAIDA